jgi:S-adenosylmethionine:tRNA ribosyltransferase-isomerase
MIQSSKRIHPGATFHFHPDLIGVTLTDLGGFWAIRFRSRKSFKEVIDQIGRIPLPPYIRRRDKGVDLEEDRGRYQTVFAKEEGAVAAPTAGLHFTPSLLAQIQRADVLILPLTLHIGVGTFLPVRTARIEQHRMHRESFDIPVETAETINRVRREGGRIIAVGTSTTRALESSVDENGEVVSRHGETNLFIYPPFHFRVVDVLVTNFHLPGSTLMMLVSAFATRDLIMQAYLEAMNRGYRFYSYGDAMMIV